MSNVLSFIRPGPRRRDWSNQELSDFYRVRNALTQNGLPIDIDRGLTDEGDPWLVFCHEASGEVFLHFARVDDGFLAATDAVPGPIWRETLAELLDELHRLNPILVVGPSGARHSPTLFMHPSAMLAIAVAALFYKTSPLKIEPDAEVQATTRQADLRQAVAGPAVVLHDAQATALMAALSIITSLASESAFAAGDDTAATPGNNSSIAPVGDLVDENQTPAERDAPAAELEDAASQNDGDAALVKAEADAPGANRPDAIDVKVEAAKLGAAATSEVAGTSAATEDHDASPDIWDLPDWRQASNVSDNAQAKPREGEQDGPALAQETREASDLSIDVRSATEGEGGQAPAGVSAKSSEDARGGILENIMFGQEERQSQSSLVLPQDARSPEDKFAEDDSHSGKGSDHSGKGSDDAYDQYLTVKQLLDGEDARPTYGVVYVNNMAVLVAGDSLQAESIDDALADVGAVGLSADLPDAAHFLA